MRRRTLKPLSGPITRACPCCGSKVEVDHPLLPRSADECDFNRLIGECEACGQVVRVDRLEDADSDRESEYMDRVRE